MDKTKLVYGVVGLLVGMGIMGGISMGTRGYDDERFKHQMSDGRKMDNIGMDMDSMMHGMMSGIEGKTGDEFDKAFLSEMIVHHQGAVDMANEVLKTSKRPELLQLADEIIVAQTKEIKMMQDWQTSWFK
ncbi:MAG: DUF305 domain-containing protein [Candidatus Pacebacteria bacterium]|nr:DUF305 domain-containing protein [Candidatus Paceibacterota bacterium]